MNQKFNKALYLLDKGRYDEGLGLLKAAFDEVDNIFEKLEIKACIMEVFYELEEFEKTKECIKYIIDNTSEDDESDPRETALEIAEEMGCTIKDFE
ncbi:MAG: hypothetical protein K2N73_05875 [Lachnospiraceae bacterium]|nr:hypothetical protein [Lachnospiraceae bacterium]